MVKFDVISILCCEPAVYIHDKDHPSYKQFHVRAPSDTATPPTRRRRGRGFRENQSVNLLTRARSVHPTSNRKRSSAPRRRRFYPTSYFQTAGSRW